MRELYSEQDLQKIQGQLNKRLLLLGVFSTILLAVVVYSFVIRVELMTTISVILMGMVIIFVLDLFCKPLWQYRRLIQNALHGRSHTESFVYDHLENEISQVDGVTCRSMVFLGTPDKHGTREQMYYWDAELALPGFQQGDQVTLRYTDKNIIGYEV